jgi:hypothetical protein
MTEKAGKDIYLYSEGAKKKPHQSRERAKAREQQGLKHMRENDPRRKDQNVASVVWGGGKRA